MKINLFIPVFLILGFSPAFGQLSDATGLVNRFDIETGGHVFEITTTANFDVSSVEFDKDQKRLTFLIVSSIENNLGEIIIPSNLLSGNFTFYLNDQEYQPKVQTNDKIAFITLKFSGLGDNKLDVYATNYLEGIEGNKNSEFKNNTENIESQVEGGGCLIATATFGSELAPKVQQLRELRENKLLQTESGMAFMRTFNEFYYSFSPAVADYERENPFFKEVVKVAITPLLASISILNYVDLDSDPKVFGYGVSVIALNIAMYFGAPALIYVRIKK